MNPDRWNKINEVFSTWLDLSDEKRGQFLIEACGSDDQLRKEVDLLIEAYSKSETFIETPIQGEAVRAIAESMPIRNLIGTSISHYRIVQPIGAGGMGEVYLAEDTRLDRKVALKILPADVSIDHDRMKRFIREAKAASAIDHPCIVHVYEINHADGIHFIAMQYIEGQTLKSRLNGNPLSIQEFLNYAVQLSDAISEAHTRGITHRDLKPANVMISNKDQIKLLDFGIARIDKKSDDTDSMSSTKTGALLGTVGYMSPEQALGKTIDHRSDIFSIGILFYEMVTGKQPFSGDTASQTIDKIIHNQPDAIITMNNAVPLELERIIRKCLEKDANNRYQSASELLIDLNNLDRDFNSGISPLKKSKKSKIAIPAALLILVMVFAVFFIYRQIMQKNEIRSIAVLPFKNINVETEYLSDGIAGSIINNISPISSIRVMARGTVFNYKNRDVDPRQLGKELGVDAVVSGRLLRQGNSLLITVDLVDARDGRQIWGQEYNRNLDDVVSLQSEISKEISNQLRIKLTKQEENSVARQHTTNNEAYQSYLKGQFLLLQRTPESTQRAMIFFQDAIKKDPRYALAYNGLADCYNYLGINGAILGGLPPKEVMPKAKELALKAIELDGTLAEAHRTLGQIHLVYDFDWIAAERELNKAIQLNPNDSQTVIRQTARYITMGEFQKAHESIKRFKELDPGHFPSQLVSVGIQQCWMREYDDAIEQLQGIKQMAPAFAAPYYWLGVSYTGKKDYENALVNFQEAVQYTKRGPVALSGLAYGMAKAGKIQPAEAVIREILNQSKTTYVPEFYLACAYAAMGKKDDAFALLNKAYIERANGMSQIKFIPLVDDLRSDSRFEELLKRMNLN
jgi:eukaryotic-like serine/threonine-protein kinase